MKSNKFTILIILSFVLLYSCKVKENFLYENFITSNQTYTSLDSLVQLKKLADFVKNSSYRKVYKIDFAEQEFVNNGVLQRTTLPVGSPALTDNYRGFIGHKQSLYLVKIQEPNTNYTAYIFYSIKYTASGTCIGVAPISAGRSRIIKQKKPGQSDSTSVEIIDFTYGIEVVPNQNTRTKRPSMSKKEKHKLFYKRNKYSYDMCIKNIQRYQDADQKSFQFIVTTNDDKNIVVQKIIANHGNKIGARDFLIFNLPEIMPDRQPLTFNIYQ